jgi:hypothetical protein
VELPGIEPGSWSADSDLLRVQFAARFSQPRCSGEHVTDRLSHEKVPLTPHDTAPAASPLNEADGPERERFRVYPSQVASGGEGEVSALCIGTYRLQRTFKR